MAASLSNMYEASALASSVLPTLHVVGTQGKDRVGWRHGKQAGHRCRIIHV